MRKSSWVILGICAALACCLGFVYALSRGGPETLTREDADAIVKQMQEAVKHKNVGMIMNYVAPAADTKIANMSPDQTRLLLARAFRSMQNPMADVSNLNFQGGDKDATIDFDVKVYQTTQDMKAADYDGHITLHLARVDVPHLLGLYHTREWRITSGASTGPDPANWGE